jgi:F420-non-reducing hydrogenase large subunit
MTRKITIDPITRLEGHGKIEIFLDDRGDVERAILQVPELRGFEQFSVGRPVEEMSRITPRICGVCPTAHHMAAGKAADAVFGVEPTATARKIRELIYNAFFFEDHTLHFFSSADRISPSGPRPRPPSAISSASSAGSAPRSD